MMDAKLKALYAEASVLEDQLQRKVFEIDKLRMQIENKDLDDMAKITRLAEQLKKGKR